MHRVFAHRPSPAMVVALVALFVSLGGSAYAALSLPKNSVGTAQLKNGAVTAAKLRKATVGSAKLVNRSVTDAKLANPSLSIVAGRGMTGGGAVALGGSATIDVDSAVVQSRVRGTCASSAAISSIDQDGSVGCLQAGARDIGAVYVGTPVSFRPEELRGWQSVTRPTTGEYCLTADPSTTSSNAVVLVSLGNEGGGSPTGGSAAVTGVCNGTPGQIGFSVETWVNGIPSNSVPFTAVIP